MKISREILTSFAKLCLVALRPIKKKTTPNVLDCLLESDKRLPLLMTNKN
jgi:hypothetical protein